MASDEVSIPDPAVGIGVILGADIEAEGAPVLPPLADRPFDLAIYQLRSRALTLGGFLRIEGFIPGIDEDILL
ncbi:hypothetical protein CsSME_00052333 [Camellia sinensis var. sinensis]